MDKVSQRAQAQRPGEQSLEVNQPFTVRQKTSVKVKIKKDKENCFIIGMCQLPDGSIVVTDYNNKRLKQLDGEYNVVSHCTLSDWPNDVCNTEVVEVAVALDGNTIQFVSVDDKMTLTRSFSTSHDCHSLTYYNKCLYVISGEGSDMYVYRPSGSLLRCIELFSRAYNITVSPLLRRIYVADLNRGLITVDLEGNLLTTFKPYELAQGAQAVCVDGAGNVFVKGYMSEIGTNNVLQVGQEGDRTVAQILSRSDNISTWTLCFDNANARLLVSGGLGHGTVTVLHLAQ